MLLNRMPMLALFMALVFAAGSLQAQNKPTLQEIKTSLTCLCDCNMTVEACEGAMTCDSADKLTAEAQQYIDQGLDKKQILAAFTSRYGEHILSAPTKRGFNLTAWITPFLLIVLAGFVIVKIVNKWADRPDKPDKPQQASNAANGNPKYEKMLDEVLKDLD